jgi:hypothetical protein
VAFQNGKVSLRNTTLELPAQPPEFSKSKVKEIREELNVSQLAEKDPQVFLQMISGLKN